jgi:hypothetical protein
MPSTQTDRIDGLSTSVAVKAPVKAATTGNITLSGEQTIDGVAVVANDRVLVKNQTTATENGIYCVSADAWVRTKDFNGNRDVVQGTLIFVTGGTNEGYHQVTNSGTITIGTTELTFSRTQLASTPNFVDLKNTYGAVGDGSTDDTAALQAALDSNQIVWVPPGSYRITSNLVVDPIRNRGCGFIGMVAPSQYPGTQQTGGPAWDGTEECVILFDGSAGAKEYTAAFVWVGAFVKVFIAPVRNGVQALKVNCITQVVRGPAQILPCRANRDAPTTVQACRQVPVAARENTIQVKPVALTSTRINVVEVAALESGCVEPILRFIIPIQRHVVKDETVYRGIEGRGRFGPYRLRRASDYC